MSKYNHTCNICNKTLKDTPNSLSLHIHSEHKDITKEQYYTLYIDPRTTCKNCQTPLKFLNLQVGYNDYCKSCAIKIKQWGGKKGDKRKSILQKDMLGNEFSTGRPKGSKNKLDYPMSEAVLQRMNKLHETNRKNDHISKLNYNWWATAPDAKRNSRIKKWLTVKEASESGPVYIDEETNLILSNIFNMDYNEISNN
jgi:hypothetical protein